MHEAIALQWGKPMLKERHTNEEFAHISTLASEVEEFRILHWAFPRTKQILYPRECSDVVTGQHLHFTQTPMFEKVSLDMGLVDGFDEEFKTLTKKDIKIACLDRLHWMYISLGTI